MIAGKLQVKTARAESGDETRTKKKKKTQNRFPSRQIVKPDGDYSRSGAEWMGRDFDWANLSTNQTLASEQNGFPKHSAAPLSCNSKWF